MTTNNSRKYPLSNRTRYGPYNVVEKYVDGHKVVDYIPTSYGSEYNLSEFDENTQRKYYSPTMIEQRHYQSSLNDDEEEEEEEEYILTPRRVRYASARRPRMVNRVYYEPEPRSDIIEYVYQEDLRPKVEEVVEYVVQDRTPRKRVR